VNENWAYYQEHLNALPGSFSDADFDSYRDYRIKLLDLLILRGRVEKSYAESQGIVFSTGSDDPYKKITLNADSYTGTLSVLTGLLTITEKERDIVYGELSKPVFSNNLFYDRDYSAFSKMQSTAMVKPVDIVVEVKPALSSSITVPAHLTPAKDDTDVDYLFEGDFYEISPNPAANGLYSSKDFFGPAAITASLNHISTINLLDQIDVEINQVLNEVALNHPECFSSSGSACDWLPEQFVERMDGLVSNGILNQSNEQCNVMVSLKGNYRVFRSDNFTYEVDVRAINGINSTADLCRALPQGTHHTNLSGLSDIDYCLQLSSGANYRGDTVKFEQFYPDTEFFHAVPDAIATYLMFSDNGIDDSRISASSTSHAENTSADASGQLFLGVSYSDNFDTGNEWLGLEGGYGIGAGVGNLQSVINNIYAENNIEEDELKASFFGHAFISGEILQLNFDIFRATAFASSVENFSQNPSSFMPAIKTDVLNHAKETIGNKAYISEINILGYEVFKIEEPIQRNNRINSSESKTKEYNLLTQTIVVIVPIVIEVDSGLSWDYLFSAQNPPLDHHLVNVHFEPNAAVHLRLAAGIGFDAGFASASAGIEGFLDLLTFEMPMTLAIQAEQEQYHINGADIMIPKINYANDFSYNIGFGSGKIGLYAKVKIGYGWLSHSRSSRKTLFDYTDQPLWSREHNIFTLKGNYSLGHVFQGYDLYHADK